MRAVDHFSWAPGRNKRRAKAASVNGHTYVKETLKHDTLDKFARLFCELRRKGEFVPAFFKVDIDAAFRRIPMAPKDGWACGIAYQYQDEVYHRWYGARVGCNRNCQVMWASHNACPFGAIASVHAWERVGGGNLQYCA